MPGTFDLIAPPHTPFHPDGTLNLGQVEKQAAHFERDGLSGVFVAGTTGESQSLTVNERLVLAERWVEVCRSTELTVIIQVGHNCVSDACTMAEAAQRAGADAVATLAPSFLKPATVDDLIECCRPVAEASPDLPFYLYDIPSVTGVELSMPEFLEKAAERIPNLKGLKFTNPDLVALQECLTMNDRQFDILFGCDEIMLTGVMFGCAGAVGTNYNFAAPHFYRMIENFHAGNVAEAVQGQREAVRLIRVCLEYSFLPAAKAIMSFLGIDCGPTRAPIRPLTETQIAELRRRIESLPILSGQLIST